MSQLSPDNLVLEIDALTAELATIVAKPTRNLYSFLKAIRLFPYLTL